MCRELHQHGVQRTVKRWKRNEYRSKIVHEKVPLDPCHELDWFQAQLSCELSPLPLFDNDGWTIQVQFRYHASSTVRANTGANGLFAT